MRWIEPPECGKELSALQLKVERQTRCLHECFFNFDFGFVVVVQFENNVRETFEVRIHRPVKRELDVARVETALLRIMIAYFNVIEVTRTRISEREQSIKRDIHVSFAATDCDGLC